MWVTGDDGDARGHLRQLRRRRAVRCDERATVLATEVEQGLFCRSERSGARSRPAVGHTGCATAAGDPDTLASRCRGRWPSSRPRSAAAVVSRPLRCWTDRQARRALWRRWGT